jgi:hypothetical protein
MTKTFIAVLATISLISLTNCASITGPSRQPVKVNSVPSGAEVKIGGKTVVTPAVVDLKGKSEYIVTAHKAGYNDTTDVLGSEVRILASVVGNIFNLTGIIGMAVDFLGTGAAYKLDPEVNVQLHAQK